jgi:hypothetical protein
MEVTAVGGSNLIDRALLVQQKDAALIGCGLLLAAHAFGLSHIVSGLGKHLLHLFRAEMLDHMLLDGQNLC